MKKQKAQKFYFTYLFLVSGLFFITPIRLTAITLQYSYHLKRCHSLGDFLDKETNNNKNNKMSNS